MCKGLITASHVTKTPTQERRSAYLRQRPGEGRRPAGRPFFLSHADSTNVDKEILDVEGAAILLGVSTTTIYNLARKGEIPATRVGREWRFARSNLLQ